MLIYTVHDSWLDKILVNIVSLGSTKHSKFHVIIIIIIIIIMGAASAYSELLFKYFKFSIIVVEAKVRNSFEKL